MKPPRKRIRSVSTARGRQLREYRKVKAVFLFVHNRCFACGVNTPIQFRELHHLYGRVGRLLTWKPGFRMACSGCHAWIHLNPKKAIERDQLAPMGTFNDYQRAVGYEKNRATVA